MTILTCESYHHAEGPSRERSSRSIRCCKTTRRGYMTLIFQTTTSEHCPSRGGGTRVAPSGSEAMNFGENPLPKCPRVSPRRGRALEQLGYDMRPAFELFLRTTITVALTLRDFRWRGKTLAIINGCHKCRAEAVAALPLSARYGRKKKEKKPNETKENSSEGTDTKWLDSFHHNSRNKQTTN